MRLHFAELYWGATGGGAGGAGKRVFSVNLEGGPVELANFDVYAAAGNAAMTAVVRSFDVQVTDGTLNIVFSASVNESAVDGIEVLLAGTGSPAPPTDFSTIAWTTGPGDALTRAEAQGAAVDGRLYVFGGYHSGQFVPTRRVDAYDPAANTWSRLADLPSNPFTHAGVAVDGHLIYLAGGYVTRNLDGSGGQIFASARVWRFDIDTNSYSSLPDLPQARGSGALVRLGRQLHFFGGADLNRSDRGDHWILDLDGGSEWTVAVALPNPRSHLGYVAAGGKVYAVGGQFGIDTNLVAQTLVHVWDPASPDTWSTVAALPQKLSHISGSTFTVGGRILVVGGESAHGVAVATVYAYDPATNAWSSLTPLPGSRYSGVGGDVGGTLVIAGGSFQASPYEGVPGT